MATVSIDRKEMMRSEAYLIPTCMCKMKEENALETGDMLETEKNCRSVHGTKTKEKKPSRPSVI